MDRQRKRPVNVPMPEALIEQLDQAAAGLDVSRSHLVRRACVEWLRRQARYCAACNTSLFDTALGRLETCPKCETVVEVPDGQ